MPTSCRIIVNNMNRINRKNPNEAARIVTGTTKLVSINSFLSEMG